MGPTLSVFPVSFNARNQSRKGHSQMRKLLSSTKARPVSRRCPDRLEKGGLILKLHWRHILLPLALLSAVLQHGCTCEAPQRLRVGMIRGAGCSPLVLAAEQKFFDRQGLQVELTILDSHADAAQAWKTHSFDVVCFNLAELLLDPKDYKVILIPAASNGADVVIARKDAGSNLAALKGARIGVPPASMGDLLLMRVLNQNTLAREDFTILPEEPQDLRESLQQSKIQLAVAAPPHSLEILKNPETQILFSSTEMPGEIIDVIGIRNDLLLSAPQLHLKMQGIWQETLHFMQNEPAAAWSFLAKASQLPVPTLQQDYKFLTMDEQRAYLTPDGRLLPLIDHLQTSLVQSGTLKSRRATAAFLAIPTNK